jgi:O-antigen ligase
MARYIPTIARINFVFLFFFLIFGTSLPFGAKLRDRDVIETSNIVNQVVFSVAFVVSLLCLMWERKSVVWVIKKEKYLTLFLVWSLVSMIWSAHSFVSFKRVFQVLTTASVSLAFLLNSDSADEALVYFKGLLYVYIPLSLFAVLFIPGALDPHTLAWRGLTDTKNMLGQVALVSIIGLYYAARSEKIGGKYASLLVLLMSVILLVGSTSITSLLVLVCLVCIGLWLGCDKRVRTLGIGNIYSIFVMVCLMGMMVATYSWAPESVEHFLSLLGKDVTFTGRTELWQDVFEEFRNHVVMGTGFGAFWVVGDNRLMYLYENYVWLPNSAHMGYLDIMNETGVVGLALFLLAVICYFRNLGGFGKASFWKWFVISALIINFQESTLFKHNALTGVMFIFGYLALYSEYIRNYKDGFVKDKV